ncbi:MAG TPA: CoB--CoM heterodisulfide reductase iron-sulfur subunit A family protein [Alphaproteobacteria bacterium]|nr:CoB--CoM heterodisulfide reductase iron-sulfur subunit A family protein [Alphaproteobacteria bacterium]MDP6271658.1 CoB--CoM heterodisulfide reductase iron-sulfur subunit A family protein [Alphaproteobacteria bacterium]MDP7426654.1 CoB--CoM heterodisulfide reductase iron-sulfur subunit A family protein [Alphaproteobacteria bacterium]HJM50929.1 CoB--CoM heterodisulfide reductase iron-sulfur subunit A family protein [Alphaproteobacteria bacterium]
MSSDPGSTILVVGGGIVGISAAVEAAEVGFDVVLVEREASLGGRVARLNRYFPKLCHPACGLEINYQRLRQNPRVRVITMAEVATIEGRVGDFQVTLSTRPRYVTQACTACGDCARAAQSEVADAFNYGLSKVPAAYLPESQAYPLRYVIAPEVIGTPEAAALKDACRYGAVDLDEQPGSIEFKVGAVVWATGWRPYDAGRLESYGYGRLANVITNVEMERLAAPEGPTGGRILRPSDGREAQRLALIQCAGSRDLNHLPYCSRICCMASFKHAAYVRQQYAEASVDIYYIDIRADNKLEAFYRRVADDDRIRLIKSKPGAIEEDTDKNPIVKGEDTLSRELYGNTYDLVVLAVGMQPNAALEAPALELSQDDYGFIVPDLAAGQIVAGVAAGPLDVSMSVQSATAAALRAIQALNASKRVAAE